MRTGHHILLWTGRIYLSAAVLLILWIELALVHHYGFTEYWSASFHTNEIVRSVIILAPGLVLLGLAGLSDRRRIPLDRSASRPALYAMGCVAFSLGVKMFLDAGLGVDPLHAMTVGIVQALDRPYIGVGVVNGAVTLTLLLIWMVWNHRLPPISIFVTMLLVGYLIDLWNMVGLEQWTQAALPSPLLMLFGLLLVAYGSALIIMSGIGIRVVDLLALTFVSRLRWRFYHAKLALEAGFLMVGFIVAGPIGIATIAFVCCVGPFVEPMIWANRRYLNLPDYGLRPIMHAAG